MSARVFANASVFAVYVFANTVRWWYCVYECMYLCV